VGRPSSGPTSRHVGFPVILCLGLFFPNCFCVFFLGFCVAGDGSLMKICVAGDGEAVLLRIEMQHLASRKRVIKGRAPYREKPQRSKKVKEKKEEEEEEERKKTSKNLKSFPPKI